MCFGMTLYIFHTKTSKALSKSTARFSTAVMLLSSSIDDYCREGSAQAAEPHYTEQIVYASDA